MYTRCLLYYLVYYMYHYGRKYQEEQSVKSGVDLVVLAFTPFFRLFFVSLRPFCRAHIATFCFCLFVRLFVCSFACFVLFHFLMVRHPRVLCFIFFSYSDDGFVHL